MNSKYNTGDPIDINNLSEEDRIIAFHEWAEGSPELEKLLNEGYKRGFLSMACCAGHGENGKPYITYDLKDEKSRKMAMSIAKGLVDGDLECGVFFDDDFFQTEEEYKEMQEHLIKTFPEEFPEELYSPTRTITRLNVQLKMENREDVFAAMAKYIKEAELDKVELPKEQQEIPSKNFNENIKNNTNDISNETKAETVSQIEVEEQETEGRKVVDESKFAQIYDKAKGRTKEVFSKIKSFLNIRTNDENIK